MTIPTYTPWGRPDHRETIADGIVRFMTPSHGGIWLSPERLAAMPEALRAIPTWIDKPDWFEEDADWAIVCLAFPEYFSDRDCGYAIQTAQAIASRDPEDPFNLNPWPLDMADYLTTGPGALCAEKASRA